MKPAIKTISWTVYPPEYKPGDGYTNTKTFLLAKKQATLYGIGSEIYRKVERHNKRNKFRRNRVLAYLLRW
jgi:hypothetical protein